MGPRELDLAPRVLAQFVAVVDTGDLHTAAVALRMAPRTLGRAVSALEAEVGEPLLVEGGDRLALTPAGEVVDRTAREVLAAMAHLRGVAEADAMTLRVAHVGHADTLAVLLDAFDARHPEARVVELTAADDRQVEQLRRHELDLAVCVPSDPLPADLVGEPIRHDPLMAFSAPRAGDGSPREDLGPSYGRVWPAHDAAVAALERELGVAIARTPVPAGSGQELASLLRRARGRRLLLAASALPEHLRLAGSPVPGHHLTWQLVRRRDDRRPLVAHFADTALGVARERSWLACAGVG